MAVSSLEDAANVLYAQATKVDERIMSLLDKIEVMSADLEGDKFSDEYRFKVINNLEYLFVRLRIITEHESIKVKKILCAKDTPAVLKPFFQSRSVYLSEISAKITLYRDDIRVLERSQYAVSNKYM